MTVRFGRLQHRLPGALSPLALLVILAGASPSRGQEAAVERGPRADRAPYLLDFNHPGNRLFRSRGTTQHVDRLHVNGAGLYLRKKASEESRWGVELTAQAGKDTEVFGYSATAPNLGGSEFLRHLGPTNVSYLAGVGKGLTLQGGIFGSLIGYDSLYPKDNFEYTRPWGADFTPYFMMGVNASYPFTAKLTGTVFLLNGYWHLAHANDVPSWGGQVAYAADPHLSLKETVMVGPHQADTSPTYWRWLTDTILERKTDRLTVAFATGDLLGSRRPLDLVPPDGQSRHHHPGIPRSLQAGVRDLPPGAPLRRLPGAGGGVLPGGGAATGRDRPQPRPTPPGLRRDPDRRPLRGRTAAPLSA